MFYLIPFVYTVIQVDQLFYIHGFDFVYVLVPIVEVSVYHEFSGHGIAVVVQSRFDLGHDVVFVVGKFRF